MYKYAGIITVTANSSDVADLPGVNGEWLAWVGLLGLVTWVCRHSLRSYSQ